MRKQLAKLLRGAADKLAPSPVYSGYAPPRENFYVAPKPLAEFRIAEDIRLADIPDFNKDMPSYMLTPAGRYYARDGEFYLEHLKQRIIKQSAAVISDTILKTTIEDGSIIIEGRFYYEV